VTRPGERPVSPAGLIVFSGAVAGANASGAGGQQPAQDIVGARTVVHGPGCHTSRFAMSESYLTSELRFRILHSATEKVTRPKNKRAAARAAA
jgi:hypothetical protein